MQITTSTSPSSVTPSAGSYARSAVAGSTGKTSAAAADTGTRAHFSPQGLALATAGVDKLATAARLAVQGFSDIGAAAGGSVSHVAHEAGQAVSSGIAAVQDVVHDASEAVGDALGSVGSAAALAGIVGAALALG